MALRYLARKVGIPALRRASAPRVSPSAGASRRLTSGSYQGGRNNGDGVGGARKTVKGDTDVDAEFAAIQAQFQANREAIKKAIRDEKMNKRRIVGAGIAAVAFTWVVTEPGLI
ncbi:unnamed protein product [Urochloa humidicola]